MSDYNFFFLHFQDKMNFNFIFLDYLRKDFLHFIKREKKDFNILVRS